MTSAGQWFICSCIVIMAYILVSGWLVIKHMIPVLEKETGLGWWRFKQGPVNQWRYLVQYGRVCRRDSLGMWRFRFLLIGQFVCFANLVGWVIAISVFHVR